MRALAVTPNWFAVLGLTPVLGRTLGVDSVGAAEVMISFGYWQRRFGGARSVLGQTLILDDQPYTIVGVMPSGYFGVTDQFWTRLSFTKSDLTSRGRHDVFVYGRLKPGVTQEGAQREMETIAKRLAQAYPVANSNWSVITVPVLVQVEGPVRPALVMLLAAAGCVLLIGAANLANLFLVRCVAREREMAVRTAIGATRGRLVGELIVEAATLGLTAGAFGVSVAFVGVRVLRPLAPQWLPRLSQVGVDGRVVAFCAISSIATVLIFGVLPAWQTSRGNLADFLKQGGRATGSTRGRQLQDALVVLQVAVALILLTGAGLLVESVNYLRRMDPGFRPEGVLTAEIDLPDRRYATPERQAAFMRSVVEQLAAQPGVSDASASDALPGQGASVLAFSIVGDPAPDPGSVPTADAVAVTPGYFRTMGIRLLHGRGLLATDDGRAARIAVVDESFGRSVFAGRDPMGRRIALENLADTVEHRGRRGIRQAGWG